MAVMLTFTVSAQESSRYEVLKKAFVSGSIIDKTAAIEDAATQEGSEMLISDGLSFADTYASLLGNEPEMVALAASSVRNAIVYDSTETYTLVMSIFQKYAVTEVRKQCLDYLLLTKRSSEKTTSVIEEYAMELLNDGESETDLLHSCLAVLDKLHGNSSFRVFFNYAASSFLDADLQKEALDDMNRLSDVYRINMLSIITDSPVPHKLAALKMLLENETNSDVLRAEAAETALSTSIIHAGDTFDASLTELQMMALAELRRLSWTRSANLTASFFPVARAEFEAGILEPDQFIEVIESVKELSVVRAGALFTDYLSTCNANVENGLSCSVPVVLAVINSLGELGDKVSFDALLYVSYVPYPEEVIQASREALARLKW